MANEIVICEYAEPPVGHHSSIGGRLITSQYLDYGELSAAMNERTKYVIVHNKGATEAAVKQGDSAVSAELNTAGNIPLPAGEKTDPLPISPSNNYIDNATS